VVVKTDLYIREWVRRVEIYSMLLLEIWRMRALTDIFRDKIGE